MKPRLFPDASFGSKERGSWTNTTDNSFAHEMMAQILLFGISAIQSKQLAKD